MEIACDAAVTVAEAYNKAVPELVPAKAAKAKWEHDEIQRMVELKASGLRHRDVATRLGRGQGSVENKYGRIMHNDEWKNYSTSFGASLRPNEKETEKGSESPSP
ncbi:hypothetical protein SLS64_003400 [Diaporthe eres]